MPNLIGGIVHCSTQCAERPEHLLLCLVQDNSSVGIMATLTQLNTMLHAVDPELCHHLEVKNKVAPRYQTYEHFCLFRLGIQDLMHCYLW